jgi:hypothetical protein
MSHNYHESFDQVVDHVDSYIKRNERYARERSESFSQQWQIWLVNAIRNALNNIYGYVDDSLVERVRRALVRRRSR